MPGFAYCAVALTIFLFIAINFLFPCNRVFPFDRRTTSVLGAVLCYFTRSYVFPGTTMDILHAVNFDVMILLSSIMIINHLVIYLKETKDIILYMQIVVQSDPVKGLWLISIAAFLVSPFLTNDGVCLLFVEPILKAFEHAPLDFVANDEPNASGNLALRKSDAIYFLLALACSANIGSALTYTGNPQNMIVSSDAIGVLPSYKFLMYMLPASLFSWVITIKWIQRCWLKSRTSTGYMASAVDEERSTQSPLYTNSLSLEVEMTPTHRDPERPRERTSSTYSSRSDNDDHSTLLRTGSVKSFVDRVEAVYGTYFQHLMESIERNAGGKAELVVSPRRRLALEKSRNAMPPVFFIVSPLPYAVLVLLAAMILMMFVNVMPISGLICVFSILMVVVVVMGNHWRNQQIWVEETPPSSPMQSVDNSRSSADNNGSMTDQQLTGRVSPNGHSADHEAHLGPPTPEDELDNLNRFFEALYGSIDYNLLLIFLGLFIVIDNLSSTGIPAFIWHKIVGKAPFQTFASILGISAFVLFSSQFLGNVPVIQLAKPNVADLDDNSKRLAWAVLSFVATVGGNLTITGSAANIIVAEKAARLDSTMAIDFFRHFHVCFWVTLLSCTVGAAFICAIAVIDNSTGSNW